MNGFGLMFLAGLAGSFHCAGMCGGFACALTCGKSNLSRQLLYNLGRLTTYCFIGAIIGQLGMLLMGHGEGSWSSYAQRTLAVLSGLLMVVAGLQFFGWRLSAKRQPDGVGMVLVRSMKQVVSSPGISAPLALGLFNGFLPCPLVYAATAHAASSGGALPGLMMMFAFGLGTLPTMLAMGALGLRVQRRRFTYWRLSGVHMAGALIIVLGLFTLARGLLPMATYLHGA